MMFWCYICQRAVCSVQSVRCEFCNSEAIEEITPENNPQNFHAYVPQNNAQSNQQSTQYIPQPQPQQSNPFGQSLFSGFPAYNIMSAIFSTTDDDNTPVLIRYTIRQPVFSIFIIDTEEDQKTPVSTQKIDELAKIQCLKEECAICQQKEGTGLMLPCKHQFHQNCIKPWFEQTNTCPCCRTEL